MLVSIEKKLNNRIYKMITKLGDSDMKFICEMGKFIGDHFPQIIESFGEERVKRLADIWNETKTN
jgi:hypothetical protein